MWSVAKAGGCVERTAARHAEESILIEQKNHWPSLDTFSVSSKDVGVSTGLSAVSTVASAIKTENNMQSPLDIDSIGCAWGNVVRTQS